MERIKINVGGRIFETTKNTLSKSNFFKAWLSRWNSEDNTELFLDRDPDNFNEILKLLRDDNHKIKPNIEYELDFYQIAIKYNNTYVPETENFTIHSLDKTKELLHQPRFAIRQLDHVEVDISAHSALFKLVATDDYIKIYDPNNKSLVDYSTNLLRNCIIKLIDESSPSSITDNVVPNNSSPSITDNVVPSRISRFRLPHCADIIKEFIIQVDDWKAVKNITYTVSPYDNFLTLNQDAISLLIQFSKDPNILIIPINIVVPAYEQIILTIEHNNSSRITVSCEQFVICNPREVLVDHKKTILLYDDSPIFKNDIRIINNKITFKLSKNYPFVTKLFFSIYYNDELIPIKNMKITANGIDIINCNESYIKYKMEHDTDMIYYYKFNDTIYARRLDDLKFDLMIDQINSIDQNLLRINFLVEYFNIITVLNGSTYLMYTI